MIQVFKETALYVERMCYDTYKHVHLPRAPMNSFSTFDDFQILPLLMNSVSTFDNFQVVSMFNDNILIGNWCMDLQGCDIPLEDHMTLSNLRVKPTYPRLNHDRGLHKQLMHYLAF